MNILRGLLKIIYPVRMQFSAITGLGKKSKRNIYMKNPVTSFYSLSATLNAGESFSFECLRGKYVLIANTASHCGYTAQYDALETLYRQYNNKLMILGFPSNDFGRQEPGDAKTIAEFCRIHYGVTFPLFQKAPVTGENMQPVYKWLSNPALNGWNDTVPTWNFCKYLISPEGLLLHFYSSAVSPSGSEIKTVIA